MAVEIQIQNEARFCKFAQVGSSLGRITKIFCR